MTKNPPDDRVIYLALKNVFRGQDAQVRTTKKVRKLVQRHQNSPDLRELIAEHNLDNVCNAAKTLLEQRIFESTLNAKIRFPEVFDISPAQSADRVASEAEAARTEIDAIKDLAEGRQDAGNVKDNVPEDGATDENAKVAQDHNRESPSRLFPQATIKVPSLYPAYLPFSTQHRLLVQVQEALERSCYSFGQHRMADIIAKEGWSCPESVELNVWAKIFLSNRTRFQDQELKEVGRPLTDLLNSASQIRHTAVHRLRLTTNRIEQYMSDAESLARLLQDDVCARRLSRLRRELTYTVEELKRNKDVLESKLGETLKNLAARRAAIDRAEIAAVEDMVKQDTQYQELAGANLDQMILAPETVVQSDAPTEDETGSDEDIELDIDPGPSKLNQ